MNLLLTVLGNGRDDIFTTVPVALERLDGHINHRIMFDDSGDPYHREKLQAEFGDTFTIVHVGEDGMGFNHAMRTVMRTVAEYDPDLMLHVEEDFVIQRDLDLQSMAELTLERGLLELTLLRNPWFGNEVRAGGVIEACEEQGAEFFPMYDGKGRHWIEHRAHMSLNPSLIPGWIAKRGWPRGQWSESHWGRLLFDDYPTRAAAYWGNREVMVEHVGIRSGYDY